MAEADQLSPNEIALLVRLLDGQERDVADRDALLRLQRKNLVNYGSAGWHLTYAGSVLAVEIAEQS